MDREEKEVEACHRPPCSSPNFHWAAPAAAQAGGSGGAGFARVMWELLMSPRRKTSGLGESWEKSLPVTVRYC